MISTRDIGDFRYLRSKTLHFPETVLGPGEVEGRRRGRGEDKIGMKFGKKNQI